MAFSSSQSARVLARYVALSAYARSFSVDDSTDMLEVSTLHSTAKEFIAGLRGGQISVDGPLDLDPTADGVLDQLIDWHGITADPVTYLPYGWSIGSVAILGAVVKTAFSRKVQANTTVDYSLAGELDGGVDYGVSLKTLAAVTADTSETSVDNGAATANGGVANLHVTAYSGFSGVSHLLEHSSNNSVFTTLGTFTNVTAIGSQRLVVAAGTTVNRYVRITSDVTGSGSITAHVSFARR